ncbi:transporter, major facilitator family protein [Gemella bergeri ATCC 700627]|uniref:Transporter, major facilitator family protein n=1 Tax=Gemella bergeri ATCC 700627 TaxID=1321820 RepID=U2QKY4_9BACL|nr:MFS transporter [Gemella bergeri]ERK56884.1 transporter, major facilitator family protein [Gemella bergeri ATCC 700627]
MASNNNKNYLPLIAFLLINYIFQGMDQIIISQNMSTFEEFWRVEESKVALVISALGVGRIISINYAGYFSDRYGRKKGIYIGLVCYLIFYIGLLLFPSYIAAFILTMIAGIGNAFLDTATYPAISDAYKEDSSSFNVFVKAGISGGQFILPLMTQFVLLRNLYFGWPFIIIAICIVFNFVIISRIKFPPMYKEIVKEKEDLVQKPKSKISIEGAALLMFSFISASLFNIFIIWIPKFAQQTINIGKSQSLTFVTIYSVCSIVSVFVTSFMVKKGLNVPMYMAFCCIVTALAQINMLINTSITSITIVSLAVGFFAAGGIWQLGVSLLLEFFPDNKGKFTGMYSLSTSISLMVTPYLTGLIAKQSIKTVFAYNMLLGTIGMILLLIVTYRYNKVLKPLKVK